MGTVTRLDRERDPYGFDRAVADYLDHIAIRGFSPATIETRTHALSVAVSWLKERGITRPAEVTKPILERYQRALLFHRKPNGAPLSFRTQHGYLVPLKQLFSYLAKDNRIASNPAADLELPKVEQRLPRATLTPAEAETVLAGPDIETPVGVRDRAILETFYSTGIRRAELIGLSFYDLDVERETVMVRQGKGSRDRLIPIGERAVAWVTRYLEEVRPAFVVPPDRGTLFLTVDGKAMSPDHMSNLVGDYVKAAELTKTGACHLFRHTMATLMLEGGADTRFIQQMLGHASLQTTQIYTQVTIGKLKEIHTATHPGATNARHRSPTGETPSA